MQPRRRGAHAHGRARRYCIHPRTDPAANGSCRTPIIKKHSQTEGTQRPESKNGALESPIQKPRRNQRNKQGSGRNGGNPHRRGSRTRRRGRGTRTRRRRLSPPLRPLARGAGVVLGRASLASGVGGGTLGGGGAVFHERSGGAVLGRLVVLRERRGGSSPGRVLGGAVFLERRGGAILSRSVLFDRGGGARAPLSRVFLHERRAGGGRWGGLRVGGPVDVVVQQRLAVPAPCNLGETNRERN